MIIFWITDYIRSHGPASENSDVLLLSFETTCVCKLTTPFPYPFLSYFVNTNGPFSVQEPYLRLFIINSIRPRKYRSPYLQSRCQFRLANVLYLISLLSDGSVLRKAYTASWRHSRIRRLLLPARRATKVIPSTVLRVGTPNLL